MGEDVEWEPNEEGEDLKQPLPFRTKSELTTCKLYQVMTDPVCYAGSPACPTDSPYHDIAQMTPSPPCVMVRAMFAYAEIPLEVVEVSVPLKSEISWSKYQKIPILTLNGMQVKEHNRSYINLRVRTCGDTLIFVNSTDQRFLRYFQEPRTACVRTRHF